MGRKSSLACPTCGATATAGSFCAMCGTRLEPGVLSGAATGSSPGLNRDQPLVFGRSPTLASTVVVAAVALLIVLLVAGQRTVGVVLVMLFAVAAAAWWALSRHEPHRGVGRLLWNARGRALFAAGSVHSWFAAGRAIVALRRELRGIRDQRRARTLVLGEAALRADEESMSALRAELQGLEKRAQALESRIAETVEFTRLCVDQERMMVQSTQVASAGSPPQLDVDASTASPSTSSTKSGVEADPKQRPAAVDSE